MTWIHWVVVVSLSLTLIPYRPTCEHCHRADEWTSTKVFGWMVGRAGIAAAIYFVWQHGHGAAA